MLADDVREAVSGFFDAAAAAAAAEVAEREVVVRGRRGASEGTGAGAAAADEAEETAGRRLVLEAAAEGGVGPYGTPAPLPRLIRVWRAGCDWCGVSTEILLEGTKMRRLCEVWAKKTRAEVKILIALSKV
jgi:hypothetical protein